MTSLAVSLQIYDFEQAYQLGLRCRNIFLYSGGLSRVRQGQVLRQEPRD